MDAREAALAEAAQLREEISMLRGLQANQTATGENASGATAAELSDAIHEREDRLHGLENGATPRMVAAQRSFAGGSVMGATSLTQEQIREIFEFYANFGRSGVMTYQDTIDSFMFMKFSRECPGLMDRRLNRTEVDLIFTKAKPKFERRLDFEHFLDALAAMADRKYPDYSPADGLRLLISNHLAPHHEVVLNEMCKTGETEVPLSGIYKKLYDPRSYTGVYAERFRSGDPRINGDTELRAGKRFTGSTNQGTDVTIHDISVLMRPNLHGAGTMMSPANHLLYRERGMRPPTSASKAAATSTYARARSPSGADSTRRSSIGGAGYGAPSPRGSIGGAGYARPPTASTPSRGSAGTGAPQRTPARTPAPPASVAAPPNTSALLAALAKAKAGDSADLIALTATLTGQSQHQQPQQQQHQQPASPARSRMGGDGGGSVAGSTAAPGGAPALTQEQIREIFEFYANFGRSGVQSYCDSIGDFMFMKFARECPGLTDRRLNQTEVDLIFTKAKPKFERRLQFTHFLDALAAMADVKYPDYSPADGLRLLISNHLAPHHEVVLNEMCKTGETEVPLSGIYKKLYDPRSYTGVYAERFRSGDPRINGDTELRAGKEFTGSTNQGTDVTIHDISVLMRPNLRSGSMMTNRRVSSGGSPRAAVRSVSPRRTSSMAMTGGGGGGGGSVRSPNGGASYYGGLY